MIIVGLPDVDGNLIIVGRSTVLSRAEPESLGKVLRSLSKPASVAKWIGLGHFGRHDQVDIAQAEPVVVAEVTADTALRLVSSATGFRYVRYRLDLKSGGLIALPGPGG